VNAQERTFVEAALTRFAGKFVVCPVTGCWHWQGGISRGGQRLREAGRRVALPYGSFYVGTTALGRHVILRAHIFVAWAFGIIPEMRVPIGHELDHECENSLCVSPWHIVLRTKEENNDYRHGKRKRRRPTWRQLFTYRGVGTREDAVAVEPRHVRELT